MDDAPPVDDDLGPMDGTDPTNDARSTTGRASMDGRVPSDSGTRGVVVIGALIAFGLAFLGLLYAMTRGRMHAPPPEHRSPPGEGR